MLAEFVAMSAPQIGHMTPVLNKHTTTEIKGRFVLQLVVPEAVTK